MFDPNLYLMDTPAAVLKAIQTAITNDSLDADDWQEMAAEAVDAAQDYVNEAETVADELIVHVMDAEAALDEEGDPDTAVSSLILAFQTSEG